MSFFERRFGLVVFLVFLIVILFTFSACTNSEFRRNTKKVKSIFLNANNVVRILNIKINDGFGKTNEGEIEYDTSKASEILRKNLKELQDIFMFFREQTQNENSNYWDSVYMIVFMNEYFRLIVGRPIEDTSYYFLLIEQSSTKGVSGWTINNFFSYFLVDPANRRQWLKESLQDKRILTRKYILSFRRSQERE